MSPAGGGARSLSRRLLLVLILCAQLQIGSAYAVGTPPWQTPDEPAHLQYVLQVADPDTPWPRIEAEDYPAATIAQVMARQPVSSAELTALRYEDHQPPLYYGLAAAALSVASAAPANASRPQLRILRFMGVLLALITTSLCWRWARLGWPSQPDLALGAAGFAAFLPMHVAMSASVNNDVLALPLVAATLVLALSRATGRSSGARGLLLGGLLLGAAFLTKLTAYAAALPLALAEWHRLRGQRPLRLARSLIPVGLGAAVAAPWWWRNLRTYGGGDFFALGAHARAVEGQTTTAAFLAEHGAWAYVHRAVVFTFDSFWGVFGWMAVFLPGWVYATLGAFASLSAWGLLARARADATASPSACDRERIAGLLGGAVVATSVLGLAMYNLSFLQHQGRYLLPALVPLATGLVLGASEITRRLPHPGVRGGHRSVAAVGLAAWPIGLWLLGWCALLRYVQPGLLSPP